MSEIFARARGNTQRMAARQTLSGVVASVACVTLGAACSDKKPPPAKASAAPADAAAPAPAIDAGAPPADAAIAVAPTLEPLPAGAKVPGGMKIGARLVGGGRFTDAAGEKRVYLVARASRDRASVWVSAVHELGVGAEARRLRELTAQIDQCRAPSPTAFVDGSLAITDLDGDGAGEVWFAWIVGCGTGADPMVATQFVLEGKDVFTIRGEAAFDGHAEPDIATWPPGWYDHALTRYDAAVRTLAPSPSMTPVLTGEDLATVSDGALSYPDLAPLPDALAAELTARMKKFLRDQGSCDANLVAPEVVSFTCRRSDTRATLTYWRERALPSIDPAELVGADRLQALCGDAVRPLVVLDRDGMRWFPDTNHPPPDDCPDGVEWADMAPTSPRAKALVARQLAPVE
jgi:hypothetical protein